MSKERELLKKVEYWYSNEFPEGDLYTSIKEIRKLLAQPEHKPLEFEIDGSFEYRDGFTDGVLYAEQQHGIGVKMTNKNIVELPASDSMTVEQCLDHSKRKDFKKVLIIGIDVNDKLITRSSKMTISEAVYFLELAKYGLLE